MLAPRVSVRLVLVLRALAPSVLAMPVSVVSLSEVRRVLVSPELTSRVLAVRGAPAWVASPDQERSASERYLDLVGSPSRGVTARSEELGAQPSEARRAGASGSPRPVELLACSPGPEWPARSLVSRRYPPGASSAECRRTPGRAKPGGRLPRLPRCSRPSLCSSLPAPWITGLNSSMPDIHPDANRAP